MKPSNFFLLGIFFSLSGFAQTQHSNQTGSFGACTVTPNSINVSCFGLCDGSISLTPNGVPPFSYIWITGDTTSSITNLCAGTYPVVMTDSTGCSDTIAVTITEPSAISTTFISSYINCQCTFIPIVTGGQFPYTYLWCDNSTNPILTNCTPGICGLIVTDANGCMKQDTLFITPPPPMTMSPTVSDATCSGCIDGTITANLTGGIPPYTYLLLPTAATNATGNFSGLAAGNYTLCASDSSLCNVCTTLTVNEPQMACSVTILDLNNILCFGDCNASLQAVANGVPPFSFVWSNGDSTDVADSLCSGTNSVIMTDSTGCIDTAFATVLEPSPLTSNYTFDFSNCNCNYTLLANGGTPPYFYQWCDGSTGQTMTNCNPGLCIVGIIDANGCIIDDTVIINPPPPLSLMIQTTGTSCSGCADGTLIGITTGGVQPYTYILTPSAMNCDTCLGLASGPYTLCVSDSNNCVVCASDTVEDDPTSLNPITFSESLRIYPNPFKDDLQVDISTELLLHHSNLIVSDVTGRILLNVQLKKEHSQISLNDISSGIYFYHLIMDDKSEFKGKLIATD